MDSFLSLFDPSDGNQSKTKRKQNKPDQDNVKKKVDPPKGRRRGRKTQGKNETLPEESSFLCEPELSAELLMKDGSYFESYIELKKEDPKAEDKKPKRRNSGRKNRRRKKVSPTKEEQAWSNPTSVPPAGADGGKVNNLREYGGGVHGVIDKLEKVILKDDTYLAGEFNAEDLHNEAWYSSDDFDESLDDDTNSESDDSGSEAHGSLPPEPRFGNVEYKLQLVAPCERRFQHLVTQLKWRLRSGGGAAVYLVGVRDCGALRGLRARALRGSLHTLRRMAAALGATLHHVTARRVRQHRAVAEVYIRKLADTQQSVELRVAVMGANEAGKSTLIGVLTQGELDNGRGSARLNMFRHLHEVKSGRTSSLSHEILGFDAQGNVVNYGCSELMTAERIGERSAKLVSFLDLAGHSKYQRTTLHGLTGYCPHYAMLVISATAGITRITEEHIGLLLALALPFFCVVSKCELAAVQPLLTRLQHILAAVNKKPLLITDENMARNCVGPQKLILDTIDGVDDPDDNDDEPTTEQIPVFPVSCVKGAGLNALHAYLLALQPPATELPAPDHETCEFQIDEIFHVGESLGPVVGGLLARGTLYEGDNLIIGPLDTGEFVPISVKSIYRNRVPCGLVRAGQSASLGLAGPAPGLRPGMVLLAAPGPRQGQRPTFGGCPPGKCKSSKVNEILKNQPKHKKHKNRNVYQKLANAEQSLTKDASYTQDNMSYTQNIYVSDGEDTCTCRDEVLLEDPSDPRGCMYFQATIHVLRHSTAISPGFQCTVHVGNVRQTAIIEGIMSHSAMLRCGESAPALFRFLRCPEHLVRGRRLLLAAGGGTRAIGRVTQIFPYVP
ncbi:GTP-binding protein 2 isoform X1 [Cydia strobilella]|uniref:GTP-binding protein 2 isoform X1 n=2 Tax=Cydia strobilella TaxID=1100964 RepID=UPI003003BF1A